MALDKFQRLEEGLNRLLAGYEGITASNRDLMDSLAAKDLLITELKEKISRLEGEKDQVREKVDGLLSRLEGLIQNA